MLAPHFTVITRSEAEGGPADPGLKSLAGGVAHSRRFLPVELGRSAQDEVVSVAGNRAVAEGRSGADSEVE
ncbi:ring-opening amidohydrolase, partial [Cohnella sp. GbtcB17]|uniref:ring-opening amidohydrolase n=1 Tax=Cohnella sp. GbtcB17 TaxID=2824762 RepID=UPI0034D43E83